MDSFHLKEHECYQKQCGEMFFTNQGRLIFHCTLCDDRKFDGFDLYEIHIKEHIPISPDEEQVDRKPLQNGTVPILENCLEHSIFTNGNQPFTISLIKDENKSIVGMNALSEEEMPLSDIKRQKRVSFKSGRRITESIEGFKANIVSRKLKQQPKNVCGDRASVRQKEPVDKDLQIPTVVREVKAHVFQRSSLIPSDERKHKCPICESAFKQRQDMIKHLKRHTDTRDHKCSECSKGFFTRAEVRIHMRSHSKERPYLCSICGGSYVTNSQFREHLKRHTNERNHQCELCQKAFFNKKLLQSHMAGHSNDRPFACDICATTFKRKKALRNHLKLHENKLSYKCTLCEAAYNQRAGLFTHMKAAHQIDLST